MRLLRRLSALLMALLVQIPGFAAEAYDLNAQNICADTHFLCEEIGVRPAGSPQERAAGDWIVARLGELGYSADAGNLFRTEFEIPGGSSGNIGVLVNPDAALPLIAIVAHYDSAPTTPGARDNAASVAILLEIARHLSESGAIQGCELHLVFLGSEENGFHGAQAYLDSLTAQARARLIGAFNMDVSVAGFGEDAQPVLNLLGGKNAQGEVVDAAYLPALENGVTRCVAAACRELYGREIGDVRPRRSRRRRRSDRPRLPRGCGIAGSRTSWAARPRRRPGWRRRRCPGYARCRCILSAAGNPPSTAPPEGRAVRLTGW